MRRARLFLPSLGAVLVMGGLVPGSALAAHELQRCVNVGANLGNFETNRCEKAGGNNEFAWRAIPEGVKLEQKLKNSTSTLYTTNIRVSCAKVAFSGEIKPAGTGIVGEVKLEGACGYGERVGANFENPKNCKMVEPIAFKIKGEMVNGTAEPAFEFGASGGKEFTKVKANGPGSGVGCIEYTFESTAEGQGETCSAPSSLSGLEVHTVVCVPCRTELRLGSEGAVLDMGLELELVPGKEWWRST